jgi:hypothetical protein
VIGNPDFVGKSTQRGGLFADVVRQPTLMFAQVPFAV